MKIDLIYKSLLLPLIMLMMPLTMVAQEEFFGSNYDYEITGAGTGMQGTYLVKVTVKSKKNKVSENVIARCAVHGVLFKGFTNVAERQHQKPLAGSYTAEAQHADFYISFFEEDGQAKNYVQSIGSSREVVKVGKLYHVSAVVTVAKDQLRKDLEAAGVIKGLNSAF